MKSIRNRISAWMLPGLIVIWMVGGVVVYRTYQSAMISSADSENMAFMRMIRTSQRPGGGPGRGRGMVDRPAPPDLSEEGVLFQIWSLDGQPLSKSENLGGLDLPLPETEGKSIDRRTLVLPSQIRVRTVGLTFGEGYQQGGGLESGDSGQAGGGHPMKIVVARDLTEADARLNGVLVGIFGAGLLMVGGMALLLRVALRNGLKPLDSLATEVSNVDPSSLHARFSTGTEPLELRPIVSHLDSLMDRVEKGFLRERRFGADLAHELRTPIAEMRTKLDLAMSWPEERSDELFNEAWKINQRMERVVETMLQLANLEGKSGRLPMETIELASLVKEAWAPLSSQAEKRMLKTEVRCADDVRVQGNADLWNHVLANLFSNAVEYTPAGGLIRLECCDGGIALSNTAGELDHEDVGQIFERFWRADGSRSDGSHSGLGLALVQACAEEMGCLATASLEGHQEGTQLVISVKRKVLDGK